MQNEGFSKTNLAGIDFGAAERIVVRTHGGGLVAITCSDDLMMDLEDHRFGRFGTESELGISGSGVRLTNPDFKRLLVTGA